MLEEPLPSRTSQDLLDVELTTPDGYLAASLRDVADVDVTRGYRSYQPLRREAHGERLRAGGSTSRPPPLWA